jgi:hypothetical protein
MFNIFFHTFCLLEKTIKKNIKPWTFVLKGGF